MSLDPFAAIGAALAPGEPSSDDWEMVDLRERSRLDPAPGCPIMIDGEEVEPGAWHHLANKWTCLPPGCPVEPLGRTDGASVVLNAMGDISILKDSSSGKGPIGGVFAGRSRWVEWAWPRFSKPSKANPRGNVIGWDADDARQALTDACAYVGAYDPDLMHGRGAWRDDRGGLTYHAGDRVFVDRAWKTPGRHDGWVYPTRPRIATPWPTRVAARRRPTS